MFPFLFARCLLATGSGGLCFRFRCDNQWCGGWFRDPIWLHFRPVLGLQLVKEVQEERPHPTTYDVH